MKYYLIAGLLCSGLYCFSQKDYTKVYNSETMIEAGVHLHDQAKYDEAVKEYGQIEYPDPDYHRAQFEMALSLSSAGKDDELRSMFEKLDKSGDMDVYPALYLQYGVFLSDQKEYDRAETILKKALAKLPDYSVITYNLGILYLRTERQQEAVDFLKRTVMINPNHASAHYFLGLLALEDGKIVEGTLALTSFLALNPNARFAKDAVQKLNLRHAQNFLGPSKLKWSESGDNFTELETILRNSLPLNKQYKVKSRIDDVLTRQVQAVVEYAAEHKMQDGFFENLYMPWMKDLAARNEFPGLSYYMLLSYENELGKQLTSRKSEIAKFYESYMNKYFWDQFAKRKVDHFGNTEEIVIKLDNGYPYSAGAIVNGKADGRYKIFNEFGVVTGELTLKDGQLHGNQKYYSGDRVLVKDINYNMDKKDGTYRDYYTNGNLKKEETFKNDVTEGPAVTYHENGGKACETVYKEGNYEGKVTCYFASGAKESEAHYKAGIPNGEYTEYNQQGDLIEKYTYIEGKLHGDYNLYYDGKIQKTTARYINGSPDGLHKTFYPNQVQKSESEYAGGKIKKHTDFFENGKASSVSIYNDKEQLDTYSYFDWAGNKYMEEKYRNGELKTAIQYTKSKPEGQNINYSAPVNFLDFNGNIMASGRFEKGVKVGKWEYFYQPGVKKSEESYVKGNEEGIRREYSSNGELRSIFNYSEGKISGLFESYADGVLNRTYRYTDGKQDGPYTIYYADGKTVSSHAYLEDRYLKYKQLDYWQSGKPKTIYYFINNEVSKVERFGSDGTKESVFEHKNKTGPFTIDGRNKTTVIDMTLVNGEDHGSYTFKDKNGALIISAQYVNGKLSGVRKDYSPSEKIQHETSYYNGDRHGVAKNFDLAGNLRLTEHYLFGDEYGTVTRYFQNGKKIFEYNSLDGMTDGEQKYYNLAGEHLITLVFERDNLMAYIRKDANGEVKDRVEVKGQTAVMESFYPNGKKAATMNFNKGVFDGPLALYGAAGNAEFTAEYAKGKFNGPRVEYYPNGQVYKKEQMKNSDYDGLQEYFTPDGKPLLTANYQNEELHGEFKMYKDGKLLFTKKYDSDELVGTVR